MFILVVKLKNLIGWVVAIGVLAAAVLLFGFNAVTGVFNTNSDLPIYSVDCPYKKLAITFDCAWGDADIPGILDTLRKENVKATFFIVGQWAEKYPETLRQIALEGHDIANHGYSHLRMGALDSSRIKAEITQCGSVLNRISGQKIELFRPPYGDYSKNVVKIAGSLGYYTIQWDVDSLTCL